MHVRRAIVALFVAVMLVSAGPTAAADPAASVLPAGAAAASSAPAVAAFGFGNPASNVNTFTYNADDTLAAGPDPYNANKVPRPHSYDTSGRLVDDGCTPYAYDGFDRTTSAAPQGVLRPAYGCAGTLAQTATHAYDAADRQTTTGTGGVGAVHYDGWSSGIATESPTGTAGADTTYALDPAGSPKAFSTGSGASYLGDDGQGTVTTVTNSAGARTCLAVFDVFGGVTHRGGDPACAVGAPTANDIYYRGGRRDATTGDYQFGSRTYDPIKNGFLSADTYRAAGRGADLSVGVDPLTANRYSYVNGDAVNLADRNGHCLEDACVGEALAVEAAVAAAPEIATGAAVGGEAIAAGTAASSEFVAERATAGGDVVAEGADAAAEQGAQLADEFATQADDLFGGGDGVDTEAVQIQAQAEADRAVVADDVARAPEQIANADRAAVDNAKALERASEHSLEQSSARATAQEADRLANQLEAQDAEQASAVAQAQAELHQLNAAGDVPGLSYEPLHVQAPSGSFRDRASPDDVCPGQQGFSGRRRVVPNWRVVGRQR